MGMVRNRASLQIKALYSGASALALTTLFAFGGVASADEKPAAKSDTSGDVKEVVVVGTRASLKSSQQIKRSADTVVDSITANDIGAFPDKSIAEALQRVAGITVNRFAATGDTAHFSAEPSGVVVRGLQQVRSEFNGRDIFTADSSRGLSWSDVSPELMGGVDTYKNQTAELIEGGIAGSINLRTRLPFDQKATLKALSVDYSYGDLSKHYTPSISGIYSTRWDNDAGEFGVMINAAYSKIDTNSQGLQLGRIEHEKNATSVLGQANVWIPSNLSLRNNIYERARNGLSFAAQWQNHEHTMVATFQLNDSRKNEVWHEHVLTAATGANIYGKNVDYVYDASAGNNQESVCKTGTTCTYDSNGLLQKGSILTAGLGVNGVWYGSEPSPTGAGNLVCASWDACGSSGQMGTGYTTGSRYSNSVNDTTDGSFNFKWDPTPKIKLNFDLQFVKAKQDNYDITADMATFANVAWDMTGSYPKISISDPTGVNTAAGNVTNPANYRLNDLMDHVTKSDGHEFATRADLQYSFDTPWLNMLKAGVRYADREQTVRWTTYNWQNVVHTWASYSANNYFITGSSFPDHNAYGNYALPASFFGGGVTNQLNAVFLDTQVLENRQKFAATFGNQNYVLPGNDANGWAPICYRNGEVGGNYSQTHQPNTGSGCFLPAEISQVGEKTKAAYLMLKFGGPDANVNGINVSGNFGVRYVQTQNISTGGINFSTSQQYGASATRLDPLTGLQVIDPTYFISQADKDFLKVDGHVTTTNVMHNNLLPSFNLKLGLNSTWVLRFAASRALTRPDIGYLKQYASIGAQQTFANPTCANGGFVCTGGTSAATIPANIISTAMTYTGSANNPYLKPGTADQFDISLENYFASVGSFTLDVFSKKFHDYISYSSFDRQITHNGVTRSVRITGPVNGEGASIKGMEVAFTRYFDFLPGFWSGFGVQANATVLENHGIATSGLTPNSGDGSSGIAGGGVATASSHFNNLPLEGLSDKTANLVGLYEKGPWSARLAYNWRSTYLVTAVDCCIALPVWQKAEGHLDASLHYKINEHVEVALEGSDLTGTKTVLLQQVDGPTDANPAGKKLLLPNAWFKNDRRIQFMMRMKY